MPIATRKSSIRNVMCAVSLAALSYASIIGFPAAAYAQTFTVLHTFTGGHDGAVPAAGLTIDRSGNLYGTARIGGATNLSCNEGCGTVFKLAHPGGGWVFSPLYQFAGRFDGSVPAARVVFGPDGKLYGTTAFSGTDSPGGTVFSLSPPATFCRTISCSWSKTLLYSFQGPPNDALQPNSGDVVFDGQGNLFGATVTGAASHNNCPEFGCGAVYELSHSGNGWTESLIYQFANGPGYGAVNGIVFDGAGKAYGTTQFGGTFGRGTIYQLTPTGGSWSEADVYDFPHAGDGMLPVAGLILDAAGNFFGATYNGGTGAGGTVFELSPSEGSWTYNVLYSLTGLNGPYSSLSMDAAGNLYGTTWGEGAHGRGNVFRLAQVNGVWIYTSLHDFSGGGDGGAPESSVVIDAAGNLYGTASRGGIVNGSCPDGCGVVWKITP